VEKVDKLFVEFTIFIDFEINKSFADLLASRYEILVDERAVQTEQTQGRSDTQREQFSSEIIKRCYLLLQHIVSDIITIFIINQSINQSSHRRHHRHHHPSSLSSCHP